MSKVKGKFGYDDALDAFGCHGIGGVWGGIATGIFAQKAINPDVVRWDGKIFIYDVLDCIRVRTREHGDKAL